jgi:hypothetical protein
MLMEYLWIGNSLFGFISMGFEFIWINGTKLTNLWQIILGLFSD